MAAQLTHRRLAMLYKTQHLQGIREWNRDGNQVLLLYVNLPKPSKVDTGLNYISVV